MYWVVDIYNGSFPQLKAFLLHTVSGKVSAVGNIQSIEVGDTSLVEFTKTRIQPLAYKSDKNKK